MLSTIVNMSANAVQVFALIAIILFLIAGVWNFMVRSFILGLICIGLTFTAASLLFLT